MTTTSKAVIHLVCKVTGVLYELNSHWKVLILMQLHCFKAKPKRLVNKH